MNYARRWLLVSSLCGLVLCGCNSASNNDLGLKRIVVLTNGDSPYWDACRHGLKAAERDLKLADQQLTVVMDVNSRAEQGQIDLLRQYASQRDIVAVGISVYNASNAAVADEMRKLQARGIPVVAVDNDIDRSKFRDARFAFVGTDNLVAGRELGVAIRNLRPAGGELVTFVGSPGAQNAVDRVQGVKEATAEKFTAVDNMGDQFDPSVARNNVLNAIANHPGVNTLVGIYSYNGPRAVDVVREKKRRADFTLVTFDAEPTSIRDMGSGDLDCMIVQNPYQIGFESVRLLAALARKDEATIQTMFPQRGQTADGDLFGTGLKIVVPDSGSPLKAELFQKTTEFLTLGEFKAWLAKYGLNGS